MKNSKDTIENRTHDLPACSAVPQQTAPPFAHKMFGPFRDVITQFNCTSATYSEIHQCSKEEEYVTAAPNSTLAAWLQR